MSEDFSSDFFQGQRDCRDGVVHKPGTEAYDRGYAVQYELEQILTEQTIRQEKEYAN